MKQNRLNAIEQYVILNGSAKIEILCEEFCVSINTIRRDIDEIVKRGTIMKIYGGVMAIKKDAMPLDIKTCKNTVLKTDIAKLALDFIDDGDTIFIDSGTTAVHIIDFLSTKSKITIISHSLNVIFEASKHKNLKIIGLGGSYIQETGSFVGISALDMLKNIKINKSFMGATGFSIENGLSVNTLLEAEIKRQIVLRSKHLYLLCDHTKIGVDAVMSFGDATNLSALITDKKPPDRYTSFLASNSIQVIFSQEEY